ncbi:MAG: thiamine phosphate synthase [Phycisphaerales bacterium]|nr:thiamine phosphate synthase [Phycisphaerales bacterium]
MDPTVWRILDANSNRAREALRVMEDHARFALDDATLTELAKSLRHALAEALAPLAKARAVVMRDTPGDVGTQLAGSGEYQRGTSLDVVRAAGKRATEALRVLEEYGKTVDVPMAAAVEAIRYRAYDLEKRIVHVADARARFADVRLYVLITQALCRHPWQEVMRRSAAGGANCFQLREPDLPDRELLARAEEFRKLCRELDALCIINDRADIAAAVDADGVHVGQHDLPVAAARRIVGPQRLIGVSTHNRAEADAAIAAAPDYIAVGPMFATNVKPEYGVAGTEYLRAVRQTTSLPIVAIGGINADNVAEVAAAGATCVAVATAISAADDVEATARSIHSRSNTTEG